MNPPKVYLDNNIVSGRIRGDLRQTEMPAVTAIDRLHSEGRIERVTSRESWREQERTRDADQRAVLAARRDEVAVVQDDHRLHGFSTLDYGRRGFISSPLISDVVDDALFAALRSTGLKDADARHLMYAVANNCNIFVTLDTRHFVDGGRREGLEACCSGRIRIMTPSEFVASMEFRPAEPTHS